MNAEYFETLWIDLNIHIPQLKFSKSFFGGKVLNHVGPQWILNLN